MRNVAHRSNAPARPCDAPAVNLVRLKRGSKRAFFMVIIREYDWVQTNQNDLSFGGKLYEVFGERAEPQKTTVAERAEPSIRSNPG
jgi:hypothetical protein